MRTKILIVLVFVSVAYKVHSQCASNDHCCVDNVIDEDLNITCTQGEYNLAFEDNFDGSSLSSNWEIMNGVWRNWDFSQAQQWLTADNVIVSNGSLKLNANKFTTPYYGTFVTNWNPVTTQSEYFTFSGAEIRTKNLFFYKGKYEIRAKLPPSDGIWPAFWLYSGGRWSEIDIIDNLHGANKLTTSVGYDYVYNPSIGQVEHYGCSKTYNKVNLSDWHIYTLEVDEYTIKWYFDGDLLRTFPRYISTNGDIRTCNTGVNPFDTRTKAFPKDPMQVYLTTTVRSGSSAPETSTPFPNTFEVDYIKVWTKGCLDCKENFTYENTSVLPGVTRTYNSIVAQNNVTLNSGYGAKFKSNEVKLLDNFSALEGSSFEATNEPCTTSNYEDVPISWTGSNAINDILIDKCYNPNYIIYTGAVYSYTFQVFAINGPLIYSTIGYPSSNNISLWNASTVADGQYLVTLQLANCYETYTDEYNLFVGSASCRQNTAGQNIDSLNNYNMVEVKNSTKTHKISEIKNDVIVFPNPSNGKYLISAKNENDLYVEVYNMLGSLLIKERCKSNQQIDISDYSPGIYTFVIRQNNGLIKSIKVIKE
ncbi:MAG: family 16 glycosylhydrolase [Bacteroidota bacterium]|nr:family 16 glycosylhydrolase [Bacteroidota bacterium]